MPKTLVSYVFHEMNDRVLRFFNDAVFDDTDTDFILIANGRHLVFTPPAFSNVKVMMRDNIGVDFGGWSDAVLRDNVYQQYDNFIFANSSVIGPFLPKGYFGKWTDLYINELRGNIKLFGSTINAFYRPSRNAHPTTHAHVQSYIFAMQKTTLEYLIRCDIFSINNYVPSYVHAIQKEVLMSRKIIENGWNIGSFLPAYRDVDFTFRNMIPTREKTPMLFMHDLMHPEYRNVYWTERQLVFIKGNRNIVGIVL